MSFTDIAAVYIFTLSGILFVRQMTDGKRHKQECYIDHQHEHSLSLCDITDIKHVAVNTGTLFRLR